MQALIAGAVLASCRVAAEAPVAGAKPPVGAPGAEVAIVPQGDEASAGANVPPNQGVMEYLCDQQDDLVKSVKSPVRMYLHHIDEGFHEYPHQAAVSFVALVMGCLCVWNGPRTWAALFTAAMVGAATSLARIEAEAMSFDMVSELLLMFQAAFATGIAIQAGFDGFQVLFGTAVGFLVCYGCGAWARDFDSFVPGFALLWYSLGAIFGALVLTVWQQPVLVTLGPLVGGFLATSSFFSLVASLVLAFDGDEVPVLPPLALPWIEVAEEILFLLGPGALAAHGSCALMAAVVYKSGDADQRRLPAVLCLITCVVICIAVAAVHKTQWQICACTLWALITAVSSFYQLGMLQNWKAKTLSEVAETWSNAGSQYFGRTGSLYEPVSNIRDMEAGAGLGSLDFRRN